MHYILKIPWSFVGPSSIPHNLTLIFVTRSRSHTRFALSAPDVDQHFILAHFGDPQHPVEYNADNGINQCSTKQSAMIKALLNRRKKKEGRETPIDSPASGVIHTSVDNKPPEEPPIQHATLTFK
jgi:hypothetical protein